jgi:hypothetical protein
MSIRTGLLRQQVERFVLDACHSHFPRHPFRPPPHVAQRRQSAVGTSGKMLLQNPAWTLGWSATATRVPSLWLVAWGKTRRETNTKQAKVCGVLRPMRASSASQNLQSNKVLWAATG